MRDTIDRIAVSVGNSVITTSDIERQIRVSAFLSGTKPDLSPASQTQDRRGDGRSEADPRANWRPATIPSRRPLSSTRPSPNSRRSTFKTRTKSTAARWRNTASPKPTRRKQLHWQRTLVGLRRSLRFRAGGSGERSGHAGLLRPNRRAGRPRRQSRRPVTLDDFRDQIVTKLTGDRAGPADGTMAHRSSPPHRRSSTTRRRSSEPQAHSSDRRRGPGRDHDPGVR